MNGIVVGCDQCQEWLLSWWWSHYSAHCSLPVAFIDMGMTRLAIEWCKERGKYIRLPDIDYKAPKRLVEWEKRYGEGIWDVRRAWLKKPFALLHSPFSLGLWLDLDCQVKGNLEPLFNLFCFEGELALVRDRQNLDFLLPNEVHYNSGVIAFRQKAPILRHWVDVMQKWDLPGDQEYLSRAIFLHETEVIELPPIYNWDRHWEPNERAVIHHYSGGLGKIEILKLISPSLVNLGQ